MVNLNVLTNPLNTLKRRRENQREISNSKTISKKSQNGGSTNATTRNKMWIFPGGKKTTAGESQGTLQTVDTAASSTSSSSLASCYYTPPHSPSHSREVTLTDQDFDGLIYQSRGWIFDPSIVVSSSPRHRDRDYNKALGQTDFDKFIFRHPPN